MVPRPAPDRKPNGESFAAGLQAAAREAGRSLTEPELLALAAHHRLLRHWGRRMNLTGLTDDAAIIRRHFLEPIVAAGLLGEEGTLVDLGSGNGFPAIPLKVLHPNLDLVLVESSEKKSGFLWAVIRELGLRGARVETRRISARRDLAGLSPCRYLTLRGVRARDLLRGEGGPLLERGGRALLFVSADEGEAIRRDPWPGLHWAGSLPLPSGPGSIVAILEPTPIA
jgi:16S rRNA (guanine527-N7)-methyltransferase